MNEDKATRYHRLGRRAGILSTVWTGTILVTVLFTGASIGVREWAASVTGARPALIVALYVLILSLVLEAGTLPFSLYRGFLLERRYGLSTETLVHWLKDHAKAVAIGVLFAELGAVFVYFVLQRQARVMVGDRRRRVCDCRDRARQPRPRRPAAAVLQLQAPGKRDAARSADGARRESRHAHHGRLRVDAERSDEEGERGADRDGEHTAHSALGHTSSRLFRRRDRGDTRARACAPRPQGHLDVGRDRHGAGIRGIVCRAPCDAAGSAVLRPAGDCGSSRDPHPACSPLARSVSR